MPVWKFVVAGFVAIAVAIFSTILALDLSLRSVYLLRSDLTFANYELPIALALLVPPVLYFIFATALFQRLKTTLLFTLIACIPIVFVVILFLGWLVSSVGEHTAQKARCLELKNSPYARSE